ncbi:hypothetical protein ACHQM5_028716 [Ranunculus cassubicifolius]
MADSGKPSSHSGKPSQKIISLAAGEAHTLALTGDGCVYSWGRGTFGRLGTGNEQDELQPVPVQFDISTKIEASSRDIDEQERKPKFVGIAAGAYHSLALQGFVFMFYLLCGCC